MKKSMAYISAAMLASFLLANTAVAGNYFGAAIGSADIEGEDDSSLKFYGGSRTGNMGFELAYHDLGKQEDSALGLTASIEVTGIEFSGVGYLPVSSTVDIFGKLGLLLWDADLNLTGFPQVSEDGNDFIFGVGAQFNTTKNLAIRLELQTTTLDVAGVDFDTEILSVGATYKF